MMQQRIGCGAMLTHKQPIMPLQRIACKPVQRRLRVQAAIAEPPAPDAAASKQPYGRVFNFSAGPAVLPLPVLEQAQADLINWQGSGQSVMEMSHRGKEFDSIAKKTEADLRTLLSIPDNYKVLFMQGGASTQFAAVPLNLTASNDEVVDYIVTGSWSKKAAQEGKKYAKVLSAVCRRKIAHPARASTGQHRGHWRQQERAPHQRMGALPGRQVRALLRQRNHPGRGVQAAPCRWRQGVFIVCWLDHMFNKYLTSYTYVLPRSWLLTCRPTSCPSLWTCPSTASSTLVPRRTSAQQVSPS